jgi:hypothetical protein
MKAAVLCSVVAGLTFFGAAWQLGIFAPAATPEKKVEAVVVKETPKRANFPEDLAPAARAKPVEQAKGFIASDKPCKLVFLRVNGTVMEKWQEQLEGRADDWMATTVENTELVVVLGTQKKSLVERVPYGNAPPVDRNRYELEVSVVDPKTGKVLGNRVFVNEPRRMNSVETWDLTAVGHAVTWRPVFNWITTHAPSGFRLAGGPPIVNIAD